jgi:predicted dehydrogenase
VKFAVLGSGFGLYGYVPALISGCNQQVFLPERYRARMRERTDVRHLEDRIQWRSNETEILEEVDAVAISRRPQDQEHLINRCAGLRNIRGLVLEKPVGTTPKSALEALDTLEGSGKSYRIAYVFRYLPWAAQLRRVLETPGAPGSVRIDWRFQAHHYAHGLKNWKRTVSEGGGALRFFGIQLIGLLAEIGYSHAATSQFKSNRPDECEAWSAEFSGEGLPRCCVNVETNSTVRGFSIKMDGPEPNSARIVDLEDPFQQCVRMSHFDRRVACLTELCHETIADEVSSYRWYRRSLALWSECERPSGHENRTWRPQ